MGFSNILSNIAPIARRIETGAATFRGPEAQQALQVQRAQAEALRQQEELEQLGLGSPSARAAALSRALGAPQQLPVGVQGAPAPGLLPQQQVPELARLTALGVPGAQQILTSQLGQRVTPLQQQQLGLQERKFQQTQQVQQRELALKERQQKRLETDAARRAKFTEPFFRSFDEQISKAQTIGEQASVGEIETLKQQNQQLRTGLFDPALKEFSKAEIESNNARIKEVRELNTLRNKNRNSLKSLVSKNDRVLSTIDKAAAGVTARTAGPAGLVFSAIPGTKARNLSALIDTIRANIGFDQLQQMRDNSPTGGALGQVSEREIGFLQATIANLEISQSPTQLRENLGIVKQSIEDSFNRIRDAYIQDFGALPPDSGQQAVQPVAVQPEAAPAQQQFTSPEQVRSALQGGQIDQNQALQILQQQFGFGQ